MSSREEEVRQQRRHEQHMTNLQGEGRNDETAQILRQLSEINDLPIDPESDQVLGQMVSTLTSTTNLTEEQVRSNEWVREYIMLLYLCKFPREDGLEGAWRGYAHGDVSEEIGALDPERRMTIESFVTSSKLALYRSEDAKVIEEGVRTVKESITRDESEDNGSGGGLLGRLRS